MLLDVGLLRGLGSRAWLTGGDGSRVQLTSRELCRFGNGPRRILQPFSRAHALLHFGKRRCGRYGTDGGSSNDQDDLTTHPERRPLREFGERSASNLFVEFRELTADRGGPLWAEDLDEIVECAREPCRSLKEHEGAALRGELCEDSGPLAALARQEPFEREAVGREPGDGERRDDRRGAGDRGHVDAALGRELDHTEAGVGDGRHAGVTHEHDILRNSPLDERRRAFVLVVIVQGEQLWPMVDVEEAEELRRVPRVLCRDHCRTAQHLAQSRRRVAQVSDRGCGEDEHITMVRAPLAASRGISRHLAASRESRDRNNRGALTVDMIGRPARPDGRMDIMGSLTTSDVAELRSAFPYFATLDARTEGPAYLDSAATSQRPAVVLDAERRFLESANAAVHRGTSGAVGAATEAFEGARATIATFVGAAAPEQVVWAENATDALNIVALGIGEASIASSSPTAAQLGVPGSDRFVLGAGDEILVTEAEHHANLVPWQRLAAKTGATFRYIPVRNDGTWTLDDARAAITARTRIFAFAHVSNVTGLVAPVAELVELAHAVGAITVLDACQSVPHIPVDFDALGVDFAAFSGHKMLGPNGIGVLVGRPELLAALPPARTGGSAITRVTMETTEFMPPPMRFEAGTQPVSQAVGLGEAARFLEEVGMARIATREHELVERLVAGIAATPGLRLLGPSDPSQRVALAAVSVDGVHAHDVGQVLDAEGVLVRVGHHCAQPLHRALGITSSTRASVHITTTEDEIDRFLDALRGAQRYFGVEAKS